MAAPTLENSYPLEIDPETVVFVNSSTGSWQPLSDSQMFFFAFAPDAEWLLLQAAGLVQNAAIDSGTTTTGRWYGLVMGATVYYLKKGGPRAYVMSGTTNLNGSPHTVLENVGQLLARFRPGQKLIAIAVSGSDAELSWQ